MLLTGFEITCFPRLFARRLKMFLKLAHPKQQISGQIQKMELKLNKPICFFDLETTGIDIGKDRIVEISVFKVFPNGNKESKTWLVNPTIPIPPQSTAIHGISDEKVANEPTFKV